MGLDGTPFSCANTPRILGTMTKAATRRFEAAFAKLGCAVLVELGTHAPLALLALYARRWEQELAYRELKVDLRASGESLLASHTPDTAAQEIVALLVAMVMVARARLQIAEAAGATALRVSFGRTVAALQPLWMLLSVGGDLLSASQQRAFIARVLRPLAGQLLPPKRRARGCPRTVRQSIKGWPRTINTQAQKGGWQYELSSTVA